MVDLTAAFTGAATLKIADPDTNIAGPFVRQITASLVFGGNRQTVGISAFPAITVGPFSTMLGSNTMTVKKKSGGSGEFDLASGRMRIPLTLRFDHSLFLVGDSDLPFVLTTASETSPGGAFTLSGSPLNRDTGAVTLVGASKFVGGYLAPRDCSISIAGTISPSPFVADQIV